MSSPENNSLVRAEQVDENPPDRLAELEARVSRLESLAGQLNREKLRPLAEAAELSGVEVRYLKLWIQENPPYLDHAIIGREIKTSLEAIAKARQHFTLKGRAA